MVSDEPTEAKTFEEYGLRFDMEENFFDDQSNGFQLESSLIRSANAVERLWCPGHHDVVSGRTGHSSGHPRHTSLGGCALVSWPELSENRLELGQTRPQQGLRAHDRPACIG